MVELYTGVFGRYADYFGNKWEMKDVDHPEK